MRIIKLKNKPIEKHGVSASYFQLSETKGVKVYGCVPDVFFHESAKRKNWVSFKEVKKDFEFGLSIACDLVPKMYEIVLVKHNNLWYPGIVMEHVNGVLLGQIEKLNLEEELGKIQLEFENKTNHHHHDLHDLNVIYEEKTKKFKVIDITWNTILPLEQKAA